MADENSKMTGDAMDVAAAGAQDRADITAEGAKSMELGDELLAEASGGLGVPEEGYVRLVCPKCGWETEEVEFSHNFLEVERSLFRGVTFARHPCYCGTRLAAVVRSR